MVSPLAGWPHTNHPPSPNDIISSIRIDQEGQVRRIRHEEEIDVHEYQILIREIVPTLKPLEEIIWENIFYMGGNQDHVPACLCYMLYYVVHFKKFSLACYMAKRMECVTKQKRLILPYDFAQILDIPYEGACVFTDRWSLNELVYGVPSEGPYQTNPPSPDDIILFIQTDQEGQVTLIRHEEEIDV
ncbi:hypothetical protein Tco_0490326 [Tanacetum coccineum]